MTRPVASRPVRSAASDRVDALFDRLLRTTDGVPGRLWGIGIGVPGPVEFQSGRPISPPIMPGWDGYPIRERFTRRYRAPGVGRQRRQPPGPRRMASPGSRSGTTTSWSIKIGTGIGAGIISDGRIHRGAQGSAGDVGHIQVVDDPAVVCRCGNIGCLEAVGRGCGARPGRAGGSPRRSEPEAQAGPRPARHRDGGGRCSGGIVRRSGGRGACSSPPAAASVRCCPAS